MNNNYTPEQVEDIKKRMEEGNVYLSSIGLQSAFSIVPFLQDTKYTNTDGTLKENVDVAENPEIIPAVPSPEDLNLNA